MSDIPQRDGEAIRILFVDDEDLLLQSSSRLLRQLKRTEWVEMAKGGQLALEKLSDAANRGTPYDAIISDLIMPSMDGAQLLAEVSERWPDTVRVLLSGQSDLIARSNVPAAQMRFRKPSDLLDILHWIQFPVRLGRGLPQATRYAAQRICADYSIDRLRSELGPIEEGLFLSLDWMQEEMAEVVTGREDRQTALRICLTTAKEIGLEAAQCVASCAGSAIVTRSPALAIALDAAASDSEPQHVLSSWLAALADSWFTQQEADCAAGLYLLAIWGLPARILESLSGDRVLKPHGPANIPLEPISQCA